MDATPQPTWGDNKKSTNFHDTFGLKFIRASFYYSENADNNNSKVKTTIAVVTKSTRTFETPDKVRHRASWSKHFAQ